MRKEKRSRFRVVATHVLIAALLFPIIGIFVGMLILFLLYLLPASVTGMEKVTSVEYAIVVSGSVAVFYLLGTRYSLSRIKKIAIIGNPTSCTMPSIIAFTFIIVAGAVWSFFRSEITILRVVIWNVYNIIIICPI